MKLILISLLQCVFISQYALAQKSYEKDIEVGDAYFEISEYDNALYYYQRALNKHQDYSLREKIAKSYLLKHDYISAESCYQNIVASQDYSSNDVFNYALTLKFNSKYTEAKLYFKNYINQHPEDSTKIAFQIISCDSALQWKKKPNNCIVSNVKKINSEYSDIAPAFYNNDLVFCTTREGTIIQKKAGSSGEPFYDLYSSKNGRIREWHAPHIFSADLNTADHEGPVAFNNDFTEIYLTRCDDKQNTSGDNRTNTLKLFKSVKGLLLWSAPESFMFDDSVSSFAHPCISKNGKLFFFSSDKPGGYGGSDIYVSFKLDSILWSKPVNLGPSINTSGNELYPNYYEEEGLLYFSSDGHIGMGGFDIYYAELDGKDWINITNLKPPINSSFDDFSFIMDEKKTQGFFSSNRPGGRGKEDIYISIFK